jgi:hypothetical protein
MKQTRLYLGMSLIFLLFHLTAFGQSDPVNVPASAGILARDCKQWTAAESGSIVKNAQNVHFLGLCSGFIQGWMQEANGESKTFNDGRFVMTIADGVTYPQLIHIFVKYIAEHPEEENKNAVEVLHEAGDASKVTSWAKEAPSTTQQ